jgi:hypothetical protein
MRGFRQKIRQFAGVKFELARAPSGQQFAAPVLELAMQAGYECQCRRRQDFCKLRRYRAKYFHTGGEAGLLFHGCRPELGNQMRSCVQG